MSVIVYLDEAGDHSLEREDEDFPVFALVMYICEIEAYVRHVVPSVYQLKMDHFGHGGVVLHSRDIRKAQGDFMFLRDADKRQPFYERINEIMGESNYQLIASVIRKQKHKERYGIAAKNAYDLAMMFCLERLLHLLEGKEQHECQLIAEARGDKEDAELRLSFLRTINTGTFYVSKERFKEVAFKLDFMRKSMNIVGTQLADLAAYPIARYVSDKDKLNPAYDIVKSKFYIGPGRVRGLKIFP